MSRKCKTTDYLGLLASLVLGVSIVWLSPANASNRALVVGVGKYQLPGVNLNGIEKDVKMMKEVARKLGFEDKDIKILLDDQATKDNIQQAFQNWLIQGSQTDNHILFYFSGHGSQINDQNGDEVDRADEVLITHDTQIDPQQGLKNALVDDDLSAWLKQLNGRKTLVVVDACHSGTVTKSYGPSSLAKQQVPKFFSYENMPTSKRVGPIVNKADAGDDYIAITAAGDNEESLASMDGSLFTLGLKQAIDNDKNQSLTAIVLKQASQTYLDKEVEKASMFHPQLSGNAELQRSNLYINSPDNQHNSQNGDRPDNGNDSQTGESQNSLWNELERIVDISQEQLGITLTNNPDKAPTVKVGDNLAFNIEIPHPGYLNVLAIGPDERVDVLFPNAYSMDNKVGQGRFQFPTRSMKFDIQVSNLPGSNRLVALLTSKPLSLSKAGSASKDPFSQCSAGCIKSARSSLLVRPRPGQGGWDGNIAGKLIIEVIE